MLWDNTLTGEDDEDINGLMLSGLIRRAWAANGGYCQVCRTTRDRMRSKPADLHDLVRRALAGEV